MAKFSSTPTPPPKSATRVPTPQTGFPVKATTIAVAAGQSPLEIDFLIGDIDLTKKIISLNITVKRRKSAGSLEWSSDESRANEIYLKRGTQKYKLLDMGGLFAKDTTLKAGQSYDGWFSFERPDGDRFMFYYPDIKPVLIDLNKLGVNNTSSRKESASLASASPPSPTAASRLKPTSTPAPKATPTVPSNQGMIILQGTSNAAGLQTQVQWEDGNGNWNNVDNWRGQLDSAGRISWLVKSKDFYTGPFRWVVFNNDGSMGFESPPFNLPGDGGKYLQSLTTY